MAVRKCGQFRRLEYRQIVAMGRSYLVPTVTPEPVGAAHGRDWYLAQKVENAARFSALRAAEPNRPFSLRERVG